MTNLFFHLLIFCRQILHIFSHWIIVHYKLISLKYFNQFSPANLPIAEFLFFPSCFSINYIKFVQTPKSVNSFSKGDYLFRCFYVPLFAFIHLWYFISGLSSPIMICLFVWSNHLIEWSLLASLSIPLCIDCSYFGILSKAIFSLALIDSLILGCDSLVRVCLKDCFDFFLFHRLFTLHIFV